MGLKVKVYNQNAESTGEMELSPKVFGVKANPDLVHQAVVTQMANMRKVLAHTLIRSEVRGGGKKPWAQKGTGRARHGSSRSPIWRGGGITFGPRNNRNFKMRINKKMRQNALLMVLSDKLANNQFTILDKLEMAEYKTKIFNSIITKLENLGTGGPKEKNAPVLKETPKDAQEKLSEKKNEPTTAQKLKRSFLIIVDKAEEKLNYSVRNLTGIELMNLDNINIVDLLKYKDLILTKAAVEKLEERYRK